MPNPTEISLLNYNFEAKASNELLTAMLNHSYFDYVTVDELRRYSELSQFTFDELRTAVYELCKRGFLLVVQKPYGHVYAVNKLRISNIGADNGNHKMPVFITYRDFDNLYR